MPRRVRKMKMTMFASLSKSHMYASLVYGGDVASSYSVSHHSPYLIDPSDVVSDDAILIVPLPRHVSVPTYPTLLNDSNEDLVNLNRKLINLLNVLNNLHHNIYNVDRHNGMHRNV